ncbi:MAG: amidase [Proteobacteria bacterium]|nr:amidase [Pseudomonadota bacterium]
MNKLRNAVIEEPPSVKPPIEGVSTWQGEQPTHPVDLEAICTAVEDKPKGFSFETVADFASAYRNGETTPEEVARKVLEAMTQSNQLNPPMRIMKTFDKEDVMRQARESTERFENKCPLGPFDGVPVIVKDELDQVPYPTKVGTSFLGREPATEDATVVARLRKAGALLLGKANMVEVGLGVAGLNLNSGTPRNPYDPAHHTGGSSSGSAASVASGLCPVALGVDGGGSIRIPAALCGAVGLKATFGRISEHGVAPVCWSVSHVGPIAATAVDAALAYAVLAGDDPHDPWTSTQPPPLINNLESENLKGIRFGVFRPWFEDAEPEIVSACDALLDAYKERGASVEEIEIPELDLTRIAHTVTIISEMWTALSEHMAEHRKDLGPDVRTNLLVASNLTSEDYVRAQRMRTRVCNRFDKLLRKVDVIASPTTGIAAPPIAPDALISGESNLGMLSALMRFIIVGNLAGLPAISFPAGYSKSGLPIGFHAMGRAWEENLLLRLARISEKVVPRREPKVHFSLLG